MNEDLDTIMREVYASYDARYGNAIADLIDRVNKAIEYIENSDKYDFSKCELLDILKGSDIKNGI